MSELLKAGLRASGSFDFSLWAAAELLLLLLRPNPFLIRDRCLRGPETAFFVKFSEDCFELLLSHGVVGVLWKPNESGVLTRCVAECRCLFREQGIVVEDKRVERAGVRFF